MKMQFKSSAVKVVLLSMMLTGCSTIGVLALKEVRGYDSSNANATIHVYKEKKKNKKNEELYKIFSDKNRNSEDKNIVTTNCEFVTYREKRIIKEKFNAEAVTVILGAFEFVKGQVQKHVKKKIKQKRGRFSSAYEAAVSINSLWVNKSICIVFKREAEDKTVFELIIRATRQGHNAISFEPTYLKVTKLAASSSPTKDKKGAQILTAKVKVSVGVEMINYNHSLGASPTYVFDVPVLNQGVVLRKDKVSGGYTGTGPTKIERGSDLSAKLIPAPRGKPTILNIAVVEIGNGAEKFKGFEDDFDANSKIIADTLGSLLKDELEE